MAARLFEKRHIEQKLIDPLREQAEFYQLCADGRYRSLVLDGLCLRVSWLWQRPLPPVLSVLKELGVL